MTVNRLDRCLAILALLAFIQLPLLTEAKEISCKSALASATSLKKQIITLSGLPNRDLHPQEIQRLASKVAKENEAVIIEVVENAKPNPEDGRVHVKLFENEHMTVWGLRWDNNATQIHDHVKSQGGIHVLKGEIIEEHFLPPNPVPEIRYLTEGQSAALSGLPYTHRISGKSGISVHIYSPPLKEMTYFKVNEQGALAPVGRWADDTP